MQLIPLEEAKKILKNWESLTYNCNTVEESFTKLSSEIDSIQTIDPIAEIDKMIEERNNIIQSIEDDIETKVLQQLKSRLTYK